MSKTKIEWTDAVWNPVTGCSKVSSGCANCYAEREWRRLAGNPMTAYYGRKFNDVEYHPNRLEQPLRWKRPRKIFVNSMSDLFHDLVPDLFIINALSVMAEAQQHTFMILTKRPERMKELFNRKTTPNDVWLPTTKGVSCEKPVWPLPNVWIGVSVEDQAAADKRIPILLQVPAAVRFISAEPLLGPLDLRPWIKRYYHGGKPKMKEETYLLPPSKTGKPTLLQYSREIDPNGVQREDRVYLTTDYSTARLYAMGYGNGGVYRAVPDLPLEDDPDCLEKGLSFQTPQALIVSLSHPVIDWVIVGGESGPNARPMHPDWARNLRDQCQAAGTKFFFKQWGEYCAPSQMMDETHRAWDCHHGTENCWNEEDPRWRVGKKKAGRELDGRSWDEIPQIGGVKC